MDAFLNGVTFLKTTETDWPIILELEKGMVGNLIYRPIIDIEELKSYFSKSTIYKVISGKSLIGYCAYELTDNTAEITALLVLNQFQKKGVGECMLKKIMEELDAIQNIKVITSPENVVALRLYLKYGFIVKEWKENYWQGQPRLVLYKVKA
ncbi:hypothetical protein COU88_02255 [Candidatus Roizmanbacteria bacterium CG10_big_fil_rev_8_21_14_0_10_39_6]|uniref:N-acetyltransferase domain-containing protein n=1 Tax=Candidatus Roizmanbacteria bacterium CG10_big_fil_rev_8_21_14_0_10_39_6 TaxID=1974853 RepID=A0A2M8KSQ0_9BACT|nr:MAG: hypothetical protein COU88_02255 [Candidatus Roizmanbacteria bacterium CG10_big_fil_rev_8_21_14_0_10_39_6]